MRSLSATYVPGNDEVMIHFSGDEASVIIYLTSEQSLQLAGQLGEMPEQAAKARMEKSVVPHPSAKGAPHVEMVTE